MILVCATLTPRSLYLILGYVENDNYTDGVIPTAP